MKGIIFVVIAWAGYISAMAMPTRTVVADSATKVALPRATIDDRKGKTVGFSDSKGRFPMLSPSSYPVTVRYLGFVPKTVYDIHADTIFLHENISDLPEYVVDATRQRVLHILAYMREYSFLTTYTDSVFLFREKMVDFMLVPEEKVRFKGWSYPRVLSSRSYYRFTNSNGLDSVSDESSHHFSWSDWIGISGDELPPPLKNVKEGTYTIKGKMSPVEIWRRDGERISVDINVLADTTGWKRVRRISSFLRDKLEFDKFRLHMEYDNVTGDKLSPSDLTFYSYNIESTGRGHNIFRFAKPEERFYVDTHAEVYILDREWIPVKAARKWENTVNMDEVGIFEPLTAPAVSSEIADLIERVNQINREDIRLEQETDRRYLSSGKGRNNFKIGNRALFLLKDLTGITAYKSRKNMKDRWRSFRDERREYNNSRNIPEKGK